MIKNLRHNRGFTILEILVSMFLFSGILLVITRFSLDLTGYGLFFGETLQTQEELTKTFKAMAIELRGIGPAATGAYPIQSAAGNTLTFFSDYDLDGQAEQIRYFMNGTTFMRGSIKPTGSPPQYLLANEVTHEVVHNVSSNPATIFTYYGANYSGTEAPLPSPVNIANIRLLIVTVTADQTIQGGSSPTTQSLRAALRYFKNQ